MAESLLVHACCGPCAAAVLETLRAGGPFTLYFYNPNIQPLLEFRRRAKAFQVLVEAERVPALVDLAYDPRFFLRAVPWNEGAPSGRMPPRCLACYRLRLTETARMAAERGFSTFTTTLLASTHQDHEAVRRAGEEAARAHGVGFFYADWRPLAPRAATEARRRSLYRQQYCGCLFSEAERFGPTGKHLYRGGGGGEVVRPPREGTAGRPEEDR